VSGGSEMASPFLLALALKYGLMFLALQVAGTLAQRSLGEAGFYAVSVVGGFVGRCLRRWPRSVRCSPP
jgi:uncharacterized membrane protein (DUF4010 family)